MPLTDSQLRALRPKNKPYKVADERGLYVEVTPIGSKLWRFRYRVGRTEKKLSIGTYPDLSLKEARNAALEARLAVSRVSNPASAAVKRHRMQAYPRGIRAAQGKQDGQQIRQNGYLS